MHSIQRKAITDLPKEWFFFLTVVYQLSDTWYGNLLLTWESSMSFITDAGRLHLSTKSDLLVYLESLSEAQSEASWRSCNHSNAAKTFEECAHQVFHTSQDNFDVSRQDLVWDRYVVDSLKATVRAKRGKGVADMSLHLHPYRETGTMWTSSMQSFDEDKKKLVVTDGEQVLCVPQQQDIYLPHAAMKRKTLICRNMAIAGYWYVMVAQRLPADRVWYFVSICWTL